MAAKPTSMFSSPCGTEDIVVAYRCYFLDRDNGIGGVHQIDAATDAAALDAARMVLTYVEEFVAIEVWDRARKIGGSTRDDLDRGIASNDVIVSSKAASPYSIDVI
jgi:hypothetical protein